MIKDYEKKIKNLYELVATKEKRIEELEKTKPTYEHEGLIIQNREVKKIKKKNMANEIQKIKSARKQSNNTPKTNEMIVDHGMPNNEAILDCILLYYY